MSAALLAGLAGIARADDVSGSFSGHGVSFAYPADWLHEPATFEAEVGSALWTESFGPQPPAASDPAQTAVAAPTVDLVTVASYHTNVSLTKKTLPRYRPLIQAAVARLATQAGGQVLSGAQRVTMGKLPGYRFEITATLPDSSVVESRLVFVFKKRREYFLNCQHLQNGPASDEIETGCDQVMHSFHVGR